MLWVYSFVFLLITSFTSIPNKTEPYNEWEIEKTENNINVYTREHQGSNIKEFKAVTVVNTDPVLLEHIIENVEGYPNWQSNVSLARILKQINKTVQYIYYTTDLPWPVSDRGIVIHSKKVIDVNGTITFELKRKPDYIAEKENFLRIKDANGKWQLTPLEKNKMEVVYWFHADPAGNIPNSVINLFIIDEPYNTFVNLKKKVEK
jgi:ribosome-associated toxin RatA of RatAB toxin-antitoxin module